MTHEIKFLFETLKSWQQLGKKSVFVSVVALDGTSYRRPGVRMIISEKGEYAGAVSGGCVEKEIEFQAQSVFKTGKAKLITYDGRLRIGCEGVMYILIEPVHLTEDLLNTFGLALEKRQSFVLVSWFNREFGESENSGTMIRLNGKPYALNPSFKEEMTTNLEKFSQTFGPLFQLIIFGAEHDAVELCKVARLVGWEVTIVASPEEAKSRDYFPGASVLISPTYEQIDTSRIDEQTAVVLMSHGFNKDVRYLMALKNIFPAYMGMVGSFKRRERVLSMLMEYCPDTTIEFLEQIHSPAGLSLGAESAAEIAISIVAEILAKIRHQNPESLKNKTKAIHA
ncbi:MAG: XdhC family protein [Bacteroidales bacterium]